MTVVVEKPILEVNGNGTQTGYSFSFSYTNANEIDIFYTPDGENARLLAPAEYKLIPNNPPFAGATVEFIGITPQVNDVLRFSRSTQISQDIDYIGTGTVAPVDVELDFDKVVRILQELYSEAQDLQTLLGRFPSPLFQAFGKFIVSDGIDGWDFFPLRFDNPQPTDDAKILLVDIPNKRIRYQSAPSIANPVLPQPTPGSAFKLVGIKDGSYQIGAEIPTFGATDGGKIAIWNGTKYIGILGSGVSNPTTPFPTDDGLVLHSKADGTTEWLDDGFNNIAMSSGVVSGLKITQASTTSINIGSGILEVVENTTGVPKVSLVNFAGATNVSIPTSVGLSSYIYINAGIPVPTVVVQSTFESLPRGSKIYIGEVLHRNNNQITAINQDYTVVAAIPSQIREIVTSFLGSKIVGTVLVPNSTGGASPANLQMRFAGGGIFISYGVNAANDILNPHVVSNIPGQSPASFRWRNALDADSAPSTTLSTTIPLVDNGSGVLSNIPNNNFVQVLVWISSTGELILQYPRISYTQLSAVPTVSDFLTRVAKSPSALKNLAPFAVLQMRQGETFQNTTNMFITPISGFSATGIAGAQGDRLPFASTADAGKPLIVSPTSSWIVGSYALPTTIPAGAPAGRALVTNGTTTSLSLADPLDPTARTWLCNGVLSGFTATFTTGGTINISAGRALFCTDATAGEVQNITVVNYAGGSYTIASIGARKLSYIYLNLNGTITDSGSLTDAPRGNIMRLFRVEHFDNVNIEDVKPIYNVLNAVPNQLRHIYDLIGRAIRNFQITVKTNTALRISSAIFYGFDSGAQLNILEPHSFQMPPQDPLPFKFIKQDGTGITASTSDFPLAPLVEGAGGTLTTLTAGNVAYYPVWMYQNGKTYIEYAQAQYLPANAPVSSEFFLTYKRNVTLDQIAVLIGVIKWENGKNFNTGNSFISFNAPISSGSGTLPLIQTTPADISRVVTVTESGGIGLGVPLPQPKADGSDAVNFSEKSLVYDPTGTYLRLTDMTNKADLEPTSKNLGGTYLVGIKSGRMFAFTNKTDFPTPTLHSIEGAEYYPAEPLNVRASRKGIKISEFTRNDDGGGLNTVGDFPLKIADLATNKRLVWGANVPLNPVGFGVANLGNNNDYYKWLPQNPTNAARYFAGTNEYVMQDNKQVGRESATGARAMNMFGGDVSDIDILHVTPNEYVSKLSYDSFNLVYSWRDINPVNFPPTEDFYVQHFFTSINLPAGRQIRGKITIKKVELKAPPSGSALTTSPPPSGLYRPEIGLSFFVTSSTTLARSDVMLDMNTGLVPDVVTTYNVNKEFSFDSSSASFFHDFTNTPDANKNIVFGFCVKLPESAGIIGNTDFQIRTIGGGTVTFGIDLIETRTTNLSPYSRYAYTTLAAINALAAVDGKIWEGGGSALTPDPTTGNYNITLIYQILFPPQIKSVTDYNKDYEGIFVHPLEPQNTPQVFLEDQTGTTKYTQRIQFNKREPKSILYEVYDIECTADQFNNWRVAMYFTNKLAEQAFKTYCDTVGASIWVINRADFPE